MKTVNDAPTVDGHSHVFLGTGHEQNERKTWGVIGLCGVSGPRPGREGAQNRRKRWGPAD
jgi:hypothetical protein